MDDIAIGGSKMAHSSGIEATASALDSLLSQSSQGMQAGPESSSKCCCGRPECAYLQHNNVALRGLEKDLHSAAQIGQVSANLPFFVVFGSTNNRMRLMPKT